MKLDQTVPDPHAQTRLRLLDLAEDASLYLRRSTEPSVRVAAALLLAGSLAACSSPGSSSSAAPVAPAVPALAQEVKSGLPTAPGTYPVSSNSLTRDAQGIYGFTWSNPTGPTTWNQGHSSLMKLAQGTQDTLEIPQSGDPILRLKPDTPINLPDDAGPADGPTPTPRTSTSSTSSSSSSGNRNIAWYPFVTGGGTTTSGSTGTGAAGSADTVAASTPAYRNPPAAEPGQGSVRGASSSLSAPTSSARTWTSPSRAAATGQAGGPGGGTAATSRAGVAQGASRPGSSIFSGGKSGSSVGSSSSAGS